MHFINKTLVQIIQFLAVHTQKNFLSLGGVAIVCKFIKQYSYWGKLVKYLKIDIK